MCKSAIFASAVLLSSFSAGCAIHPLPEDVTGVKTTDIVRSIRCEARDGVRHKIAAWLRFSGAWDPEAAKLAPILDQNPRELDNFKQDLALLAPDTVKYINFFAKSVISYNFTFDMTELNNLDATVDLMKAFKGATGTAALTAGLDRSRENIRTFTISDEFSVLVYQLNDSDYCDGLTHDPNYIYPITGKIGIAEMIDTFVDLALFANLSKAASSSGGSDPKNAQGAVPAKPKKMAQTATTADGSLAAMGDTVTFTTKLSGSATPKIVISPATAGVADASLAASLSRTDVHKVIVGMSVPLASEGAGTRRSLLTQVASTSGSSPKERSLEMIAQQILRFENRRTVGPNSLIFSE